MTTPVETLTASTQVDYFGFSGSAVHVLPDGVSTVTIKTMNEGEKSRYQKLTQRDVVLERGSGNARMKMDPSEERHALLETCITDWNLVRNGVPIPFGRQALNDFLKLADPKVVEDIEKACRKANPWLLSDMTVEDIDREIENLKEMRQVAEEREQGK